MGCGSFGKRGSVQTIYGYFFFVFSIGFALAPFFQEVLVQHRSLMLYSLF